MNWIDKANISVYDGKDGELVLHSPLARKTAIIGEREYELIKDLTEAPAEYHFLSDYIPFEQRDRVITPEDYTLLTVLPNNRCNFTCSYCYSANCRNTTEIDAAVLNKCIDFFVISKRSRPLRRKLSISFMGGGEPMLSWQNVKDAVCYAKRICSDEDINISFRIITNGSILDDEKILFIKDNHIGISISFEILEDIQNLQRKHFALVRSNINKALALGVDVQLNVTITPNNIDRMIETYDSMREYYPQVKNAMFEPVTSQEMFETPEKMGSLAKPCV